VNDRQFQWGLSNGVMVFAIAGAFWLGLGIGMAANSLGGLLCALGTVLQAGVATVLIWIAVRRRRRSGFRAAELREEDGRRTPESRRILIGFYSTAAGQTALIALAVWLSVSLGKEELVWPAIALVVSLHLIPLARIFHVRAYYATAAAGSVISITSIVGFSGLRAVEFIAVGMATVMWASAVHLLWHADAITVRGLREPWAT
jgi:hypothetical protein